MAEHSTRAQRRMHWKPALVVAFLAADGYGIHLAQQRMNTPAATTAEQEAVFADAAGANARLGPGAARIATPESRVALAETYAVPPVALAAPVAVPVLIPVKVIAPVAPVLAATVKAAPAKLARHEAPARQAVHGRKVAHAAHASSPGRHEASGQSRLAESRLANRLALRLAPAHPHATPLAGFSQAFADTPGATDLPVPEFGGGDGLAAHAASVTSDIALDHAPAPAISDELAPVAAPEAAPVAPVAPAASSDAGAIQLPG